MNENKKPIYVKAVKGFGDFPDLFIKLDDMMDFLESETAEVFKESNKK